LSLYYISFLLSIKKKCRITMSQIENLSFHLKVNLYIDVEMRRDTCTLVRYASCSQRPDGNFSRNAQCVPILDIFIFMTITGSKPLLVGLLVMGMS